MSDTAAPKKSFLSRLIPLGLVGLLAVGGAGFVAFKKAVQDEPLAFEPFRLKPLEEAALVAKFEFLGNLKSLLLGDSTAEVKLDQREFNALLFGNAQHDANKKVRVLVEGDQLIFESSTVRDGEPATWVNVHARVQVEITTEGTTVDVLEGTVGDLPLVGPLKGWIGNRAAEGFEARRQQNPRLQRLKELWVKEGRVHLVYEPG